MNEHLIDQVRELAAQGMRPREMAQKLNVTRQWIYAICGKQGIAYPKRSDAMPPLVGPPRKGLKTGVAGTIAEMLVAGDLLRQGFDVYRSLLNNSHGYDLVALKDGKFITIEVRAAWRNEDGLLRLPYKMTTDATVHAFVVVGEPVIYKPPLGPDEGLIMYRTQR
jgi:hypothetical protein